MNDCYTVKEEMSEDEKFKTDYYEYLEQPENSSRYTIGIEYLKLQFNREFSLLDVGSASGAVAKYANGNCKYFGIDMSPTAIELCKKKYPSHNFIQADMIDYFSSTKLEFDAIFMSGMIGTPSVKDIEDQIILSNVKKLVSQTNTSFLVINSPFFYRDHKDHGLFSRIEWRLVNIREIMKFLGVPTVFEAISLQIGLEKKIIKQKVKPAWFLEDPYDADPNIRKGTYVGTVTLVYKT